MSLDNKFNNQLSSQKYDAYNIQFDCLKEVIDHFEAKNGRTSDFGFYYMKYFARACEITTAQEINSLVDEILLTVHKP